MHGELRDSIVKDLIVCARKKEKKGEERVGSFPFSFTVRSIFQNRNKSHKNWKIRLVNKPMHFTPQYRSNLSFRAKNCSILAVNFSSPYIRIDIIMSRIGYCAGQF